MIAFRILLAAIFFVILGYTLLVGAAHGYDLLPVFFGDIAKFGWAGQFNVDFSSFLILSALWVAWRGNFAPGALALGVFAFFLGGLFLSAYLLFLSLQPRGDVAIVLLGRQRVATLRGS